MATALTILGLGQTGISIGLALADKLLEIERTGWDPEPGTAATAKKAGAVDTTQKNIHEAVKNADLVILDLPEEEVDEAINLIRDGLKQDALVMDTTLAVTHTSAWIRQDFPNGRHFVGFMPIVGANYLGEPDFNSTGAREDLFKDGSVLITTHAVTHPDSVRVAAELAGILKCKPLFIDPVEADGLLAAVNGLPLAIAAALVNATMQQPGWKEGRKVAGKPYAQASNPLEKINGAREPGLPLIHNKDNCIRVLNDLMARLKEIRDLIDAEDQVALDALLIGAFVNRKKWIKQRITAEWETKPAPMVLPTPGETLGRMFGFRGKRPGRK